MGGPHSRPRPRGFLLFGHLSSTTPMPTFSVYIATNPFGRVMQVWGTPHDMFTELIATDYPDPDTCTTTLVISTPSYSEAIAAFDIQARVLRTYANALGVRVHAINPYLES